MKKSNICLSALMAGLLAAGAAQAQSTPPAGNAEGTPKAGEVNNRPDGAANAATPTSPAVEVPISTKDQIRQDAAGMSRAATSPIPNKAGEMSTTVQNRPNANPDDPLLKKSRAEVRNELMMRRAQAQAARSAQLMGNARYGAEPGTPDIAPAGTPPLTKGGTPQ